MSIASEIQNLITNLAAAYTSCTNKGATIPQNENFDNLANCIDSIPTANLTSLGVTPSTTAQTLTPTSPYNGFNQVNVSAVTSSIDANITAENIKKDVNILGVTGTYEGSGGGDSGGEYLIQVVDEYGNILKQDHLNEGATFEMPTPPTRTGLTFEKWIGGAPVTNGNVTMPDYDVYFMPIYCTTSGAYELKIKVLSAPTTVDIQNVWDAYVCDWGDGSTPVALNNTSSHSYTSTGIYTISITMDDTCYSSLESSFNYQGTDVEIIEINNSNRTNQNGARLNGLMLYPQGSYSNYPDYLMRPSSTSIICHISAIYPTAISKNSMQTDSFDFYKMIIPDYTISDMGYGAGSSSYSNAYMNTSASNMPSISGVYANLGVPAFTTIVSLASSINNFTYNYDNYANTYYLKNLTNIPTLSISGSSPYFSNRANKIIVPFNMWATLMRNNNWIRIKPVVTSKTPATINPTIGAGGTLSVFGEQVTGQFLNYGSEFDFSYNDGTSIYTGTYTGLQPNSVNNIDFGALPYKTITISCGVSGLVITSDTTFTDNGDGTYTARIYSTETSLPYSINGGASYMDTNGTIDLTQQSPITETVTLVPATETAWTQPTLSANGTIGGSSFAVKAQSIQTSYVWRAFDNSDSTTWGQSGSSTVYYNTPALLIYNPEGLKISQIVFHTTSTTASYPTIATTTNGRKFQASNDGENWVTLSATAANDTSTTSDRIVTFDNNNEYYKYYRYAFVYTSSGSASTYAQMVNTNKRIDITATYKVAST